MPTAGSATDYAYNSDGQVCWTGATSGSCSAPPTGATSYTYNTAGERAAATPTGGNPTTFGWNQAGNLLCSTAPNSSGYTCANPTSAVTSTYTYNGDGLRTSDTPAGGTTQNFSWDTSGPVPQLLEDGTDYYLYGPSISTAPIEQISISSSTPTYLVSDTTGVREQLNTSGTSTGTMTYDTYGDPCNSCTLNSPFGFEGAYTDSTSLLYLTDRYYDPTTAQFLSVDPLVAETHQPYAYADDDPVNATDPLGSVRKCV